MLNILKINYSTQHYASQGKKLIKHAALPNEIQFNNEIHTLTFGEDQLGEITHIGHINVWSELEELSRKFQLQFEVEWFCDLNNNVFSTNKYLIKDGKRFNI